MSTNRPNKNTNNNKEYKQTSVDRSVIDDFNARIKKNPDDASAYLNRGLVYHTLGSYDQAIEDFNKAIQLMPDLNTHVKPLLEEAIQKNHNDLKKIPDTILVPTQSSLLDLKETSKLSRVTKRHHELFKPAVALKKLLRLCEIRVR